MIVSVASGKGGTGKTLISTNLVLTASILRKVGVITYLDCDVEEPNGHLFLKPRIDATMPVGVPVPVVNEEMCTHCGLCGDICQYSAIVCVRDKILTFPELCHACGGCARVCPQQAISEDMRTIGVIEKGWKNSIQFVHGILRIGEAMSPPLIKAVRASCSGNTLHIIDAPPGTSCPVITAIKGSDFVLLVTEPTPFGLNDLSLALDMVDKLGLPHAVLVNRAEAENDLGRKFCKERGIEIIAEIPDDRRIAEAYSRGEMIVESLPEYKGVFVELLQKIEGRVQR